MSQMDPQPSFQWKMVQRCSMYRLCILWSVLYVLYVEQGREVYWDQGSTLLGNFIVKTTFYCCCSQVTFYKQNLSFSTSLGRGSVCMYCNLLKCCTCTQVYTQHMTLYPTIVAHTMNELKLTGNCLKGSRPLLSFDPVSVYVSQSYQCHEQRGVS